MSAVLPVVLPFTLGVPVELDGIVPDRRAAAVTLLSALAKAPALSMTEAPTLSWTAKGPATPRVVQAPASARAAQAPAVSRTAKPAVLVRTMSA